MVQKFIISDQFDVRRIYVEVLHRKEDQYKVKKTTRPGRSDTGNPSDLYF